MDEAASDVASVFQSPSVDSLSGLAVDASEDRSCSWLNVSSGVGSESMGEAEESEMEYEIPHSLSRGPVRLTPTKAQSKDVRGQGGTEYSPVSDSSVPPDSHMTDTDSPIDVPDLGETESLHVIAPVTLIDSQTPTQAQGPERQELREKNMTVQCVLCKPKIRILSTSKNSTSNLKKHLERKHASMYLKSKGGIVVPNGPTTSNSSREPRYKKSKLENLNQITSQPKVNALVFNFMIEDVQSLSVLEQPAFRKLIDGLSGGKLSMTKNTFIDRLEMAYSKMKEELKEKLDSVQSVCTTADIWSAHNRSYIGITCHWFEKNELERKSAALACARIRGAHTFDKIAAKIHEIHVAYNIENKLQAIVTDNGSKFVKVFNEFSKVDNEEIAEDDIVEFQDVGIILDGADEAMHHVVLPHQRCASHALNLIASQDLAHVLSQGETARVYFSAMGKCYAIWNGVHQSPLSIVAMEDMEKMKLTAPCVTRWTYEYSAIEKIVSLPEAKLMDACDSLGVPRMLSYEIAFLKEYTDIFKPLSFALELFQGEQKCFLGLVIPTVLTLKKKLCEKKAVALYLFDVINPVLEAIETRFKQLFASLDAKLATATTPQFRLWWLPETERDDMHLTLVAEANRIEPSDGAPIGSDEVQSEDEFFSFGPGIGNSDTEEEVRRYLEGTSKNLGCLKLFPRVRKLFLKYNTILPSSAPVERLFSHNGIILTPQGNGLTDEQFEQVLLLRYNSKIFPE
ncbi:hypothetical protein DPEC_G00061790 [Dallia pectoralis]|uniref:Uncharacterized protein n=1 Tax=Dallia pectoralis TaxID=75939 RepID=A0ACC2H7D5_DALPE|nr:hypothetical protein DPEC_G00061790 [Dallia pectoralis]